MFHQALNADNITLMPQGNDSLELRLYNFSDTDTLSTLEEVTAVS